MLANSTDDARPESGSTPDLSLFPPGTSRGPDGALRVGGFSLREVALEFGTPALVIDEGAVRARAREFRDAFGSRHANSQVYFASKAFPSPSILTVLAEEGLNFDVASGNELAVARAAGVTPARMLLHGNAKSAEEIADAVAARIGHIVIDNLHDVERIAAVAGSPQPVLLRVTPGISAHTHEANATGHAGSKFGVSMADAPEVIERIRREPNLRLDGLHAHIGSQIFDLEQFREEVAALATLPRFGTYDVGGGLAARYVSNDPAVSVDEYAAVVVDAVHRHLGPGVRLLVEPGRAMVASCGVSLYSVVTVKRGPRTHVAIDGGMGDNMEVSLYGQRFQPWLVERDAAVETVDLVGHHCESGDILVRDARLPRAEAGDLVVVPVTGAYTYSMSNNYNAALRPPIVLCRDGHARMAVRRETLDDLLVREVNLRNPVAGA